MTEYNKLNHWYGWNGGEPPATPKSEVKLSCDDGIHVGKVEDFDEWTCPTINAFMITKIVRGPREVRLSKSCYGEWIESQQDAAILFREVIDD